jgi:phage shock protein PspC (stress-responsive transcriptional regulator)
MNKVIAINLNGNAYQLEEGAYEALRTYLDGAARRLEGNPDRDEIIVDIEQAIADKCRSVLGANKTVVLAKEIAQIIDEMGPVEDASVEADASQGATGAAPGGASGGARPETGTAGSQTNPPVRRLFKIPEGGMIAGVCNGLAAFFNIDVTWVRIAFVLLCIFWGTGVLVYVLLAFILPTARTSAEKAAAYRMSSTAQEFIRRAKEGYYEGMKTFADKHAHREWRRRFRQEMRSWRGTFRQDMGEHTRCWSPGAAPGIGAWFVLPFVSILRTVLPLLWIFALISLLATGAVFGVLLPWGIPVWAGVLSLFVLYLVLVSPLKAMRRAGYWNAAGGPFYAPPFVYVFDAVIGVGFVVFLLWMAAHHMSQIHEAVRHISPVVRDAVDDVKSWWAQR